MCLKSWDCCKFITSVRKTQLISGATYEPFEVHYLINNGWVSEIYSHFPFSLVSIKLLLSYLSQVPLPTPSSHTSLGNLLHLYSFCFWSLFLSTGFFVLLFPSTLWMLEGLYRECPCTHHFSATTDVLLCVLYHISIFLCLSLAIQISFCFL